MNLIQALNTGYNLLKSSKINSYKIDTEILLSASLKISKEKMILNLEKEISFENYESFLTKIKRRKANEPIAYILKKKEFWKNNFYLNKHILVPRPETELLVEESLDIIAPIQKKKLLEIGVGSGCIIISILKERVNCSAIV